MPRHRRSRLDIDQANLFHPKRQRPAWETLPLETRKEVTKLIARMQRAYAARHAAGVGGAEEVRHD